MRTKVLKSIFLIILIGLGFVTETQSQTKDWTIVDTSPDYNEYLRISYYWRLKFADSLNGMIAANYHSAGGHYLRRTTDGGRTWKTVYNDSAYYFMDDNDSNDYLVPKLGDLSYPNTKLCIAVGDSGLILRTTDRGETWKKQRLNDSIDFYRVFLADEFYGFIQGSYHRTNNHTILYETTDGGLSWHDVIPFIGISNINFINSNLFCGFSYYYDKDSIYHISLNWIHNRWKKIDTLESQGGTGLFFLNENIGWISGNRLVKDSAGWTTLAQLMYKSVDGGKFWVKQRDKVFEGDGIYDLSFFDENFGMVCGFVGLMLITTDGGTHWKEDHVKLDIPNGYFFRMHDVQVVSPTTAFVIGGEDDYIYKYTRDLSDVVVESKITYGDIQISPNPATDFLEISYPPYIKRGLGGVSEQNIEIFSVLGVKIPPRLTPSGTPQEGNFKIDVSSLPQGIYFVKVGAQVGKFVKI